MIYNYTRCESVIAKIMTDLDSSEVNQRTSDIKEWIFEAVDKIGAPMQYIKKESGEDGHPLLKIEDHQVPIPSDLIVLDGVAYSQSPKGPWTPVIKSTGVFKDKSFKNLHNDHRPHKYCEEDHVNGKLFTSQSQFYTINGMKYAEHLLPHERKPEYFIKPGWLVVNRPKGFIKLAYKAIAVDERGYPLIPDLTSYQEAIYWYVTMKLMYPKLLKGTLGGRGINTGINLYNDARMQWNFYRNQAYAEAMMPTADDIENIKNDWHKLIPEWDSSETFFKDINKEQSVYTDYYYGY